MDCIVLTFDEIIPNKEHEMNTYFACIAIVNVSKVILFNNVMLKEILYFLNNVFVAFQA